MEPRRIPSEAEIRAADREGEEAVVQLFYETFSKIAERLQKLEDPVARTSGNRSTPPSSDGLKKKPKSLRHKSGKTSGGQSGQPGHTLKAVSPADQIQVHRVKRGRHGQMHLEDVAAQDCERRLGFDVPPVKVEVTEPQAEITTCPEGHRTTVGEFPAGVTQPVPYGERLKAQMVYFHQYHDVSLERTAESVAALYGQTVREGTSGVAGTETAQPVEPIYTAAKAELSHTTDPGHFDETGLRIEGKRWWLHVVCTARLRYFAPHRKRGCEALDAPGLQRAGAA